ncbi:MAG: AAA family ATPase [Pseudomonadota bacterium]
MERDAASEGEMRALLAAAGCPERIETHISVVHLGSERVLKRKKPITFPFVDFAPLARREAACRREVAVNRAYAAALYRGLRPVLRDAKGALSLGPLLEDPAAPTATGRVVDWVVEMRRFPSGAEFDRMAERGALDAPLVDALADRIAEIHRAAPKQPLDRRGAAPEATIAQVRDSLAGVRLGDAADAWGDAAAQEAERCAAPIAARRRHGAPRRLHGDLHLGNICLLGGAPTPFDAIEFDEVIATIDPLYDIAFTAMDLLWREERALAQRFLSRYLSATRDYGGLALWPLFLSLRAAIRAMTAGLAGDERRARDKLAFAARLLTRRPSPRLIAVAGLSGAGKSQLAAAIAPSLSPLGDAVVLSSDVTRKRLLGAAPETRLPASAYAPEVSARVYARIRRDARRALNAGASVVLDAVNDRPADKRAAAEMAAALGVPFDGLALSAPLAARLKRVAARSEAGGDPSDAGVEIAERQEAAIDPQSAVLPEGWRPLDASAAPCAVAAQARAMLGLSPEDAARRKAEPAPPDLESALP